MNSSTEHVLELFRQINAVPRCSEKERALSDWLVNWAKDRGLDHERDDVLNVLIRVPGRLTAAGAEPVAIQGHMDMVCEKTPDSSHNFDSDPIRTVADGDWLTAEDTTLGADNGIAVALALALAEDESIAHPPLELLLTVDEESGLTGAQNLRPDWLRAKTLLNLDSEDEGVFTVGCAGGLNSLITLPVEQTEPDPELAWVKLTIGGLQGGHSGIDIHVDRANANVLAARVATDLREKLGVVIAELHGGNAHNAIPRDAHVTIGLPPSKVGIARSAVSAWKQVFLTEYSGTDPALSVELEDTDRPSLAFVASSADAALNVLLGLPHGVIRMSRGISGLVETSSNLATVRTSKGKLEIDTSQRSSSESQLEAAAARIAAVAHLGGGSVRVTSRYSPWEPQTESKLLEKASEVYRGLFGSEPTVEVVHAGLECGIIGSKYPGMEMLSMGPTIQLPHSPDERLNIPSLGRTWSFLVQLLANLR